MVLLGRDLVNFTENSLTEQYMLGILIPVSGRDYFKVVFRDSSRFNLTLLFGLLDQIGSPVKYIKYYTVDDLNVIEGSVLEPEDYSIYHTIEVRQRILSALVFVSVTVIAFLLFKYFDLSENALFSVVYWFMFVVADIVFSLLLAMHVFPQKESSIDGYFKV